MRFAWSVKSLILQTKKNTAKAWERLFSCNVNALMRTPIATCDNNHFVAFGIPYVLKNTAKDTLTIYSAYLTHFCNNLTHFVSLIFSLRGRRREEEKGGGRRRGEEEGRGGGGRGGRRGGRRREEEEEEGGGGRRREEKNGVGGRREEEGGGRGGKRRKEGGGRGGEGRREEEGEGRRRKRREEEGKEEGGRRRRKEREATHLLHEAGVVAEHLRVYQLLSLQHTATFAHGC